MVFSARKGDFSAGRPKRSEGRGLSPQGSEKIRFFCAGKEVGDFWRECTQVHDRQKSPSDATEGGAKRRARSSEARYGHRPQRVRPAQKGLFLTDDCGIAQAAHSKSAAPQQVQTQEDPSPRSDPGGGGWRGAAVLRQKPRSSGPGGAPGTAAARAGADACSRAQPLTTAPIMMPRWLMASASHQMR